MTVQPKQSNKAILAGLTVTFALGISLYTPAFAAESETETEANTNPIEIKEPTESTKKSSGETTNESNKKAKRGKDGEIFRPSEEISEDFAVSFPVDI